MAIRRKEKRPERSKLDATPPWDRRKPPPVATTKGPFDLIDAPADEVTRIDLGALRVPVSDLEMRVDVNEAQEVVSVTLVGEHGHMQLGAFAAPRSEGIWDDVRNEILESVTGQGGSAADAEDGELGVELIGKLPVDGAGLTPVRFVGVNGPRWMLRAMLVGPCAADAAKGAQFIDVLRQVVVVRGSDPLPVREPIPLQLPPDIAEQLAAGAG
jgi:Protein of unknown function (DUF3710)